MSIKSDEQNIVKRCLQGDKTAQEQLYNAYANKMFAVCLRYANSRPDAEDVLQNGFIKVFKNLKRFQFKGSFEGWIRRIMVNSSIEHYRKNVKWMYTEDAQEVKIATKEIGVLQTLRADDILALVQKLPTGYRTVFNLFVIEGYAHQEIAKMLQVSESTSKTQLFKARAALQVMLKELEERER